MDAIIQAVDFLVSHPFLGLLGVGTIASPFVALYAGIRIPLYGRHIAAKPEYVIAPVIPPLNYPPPKVVRDPDPVSYCGAKLARDLPPASPIPTASGPVVDNRAFITTYTRINPAPGWMNVIALLLLSVMIAAVWDWCHEKYNEYRRISLPRDLVPDDLVIENTQPARCRDPQAYQRIAFRWQRVALKALHQEELTQRMQLHAYTIRQLNDCHAKEVRDRDQMHATNRQAELRYQRWKTRWEERPKEIEGFVCQIVALENSVQAADERNARLERQLRDAETQNTGLEQRIELINNANIELVRAVKDNARIQKAELQRQIDALTDQNTVTENRLSALQTSYTKHQGEYRVLSSQKVDADRQLWQARIEVESAKKKHEHDYSLLKAEFNGFKIAKHGQIESFEAGQKQLQHYFDTCKIEKQRLSQELDSARKDNWDKAEEVARLNTELLTMTTAKQYLEEQLQFARNEISVIETARSSADARASLAENKIAALEKGRREDEHALVLSSAEKRFLQRDMATLKQEHAEDRKTAREQLLRLWIQKQATEKQLQQQIETLKRQTNGKGEELAGLQMHKDELRANLAEKEGKLAVARDEKEKAEQLAQQKDREFLVFKEEVRKSEDMIDDVTRERDGKISNLRDELVRKDQDLRDREDESKRKLRELTTKLEEKEASEKELSEQLSTLSNEQEDQLRQKSEELAQLRHAHEKELRDLKLRHGEQLERVEQAKSTEHHKALDKLREEKDQLMARHVQEEQQKYELLKSQKDAIEIQHRDQLAVLKQQLQDAQGAEEKQRADIAALQESLREAAEQKQRETTEHQQQVSQLEKDVEEARVKHRAEINDLQQSFREAAEQKQQEFASQLEQQTKLADRNLQNALEEQQAALEAKIEVLEQTRLASNKKAEQLQAELEQQNDLSKQTLQTALEEQQKAFEAKIEALEQTKLASDQKAEQLHSELEELKKLTEAQKMSNVTLSEIQTIAFLAPKASAQPNLQAYSSDDMRTKEDHAETGGARIDVEKGTDSAHSVPETAESDEDDAAQVKDESEMGTDISPRAGNLEEVDAPGASQIESIVQEEGNTVEPLVVDGTAGTGGNSIRTVKIDNVLEELANKSANDTVDSNTIPSPAQRNQIADISSSPWIPSPPRQAPSGAQNDAPTVSFSAGLPVSQDASSEDPDLIECRICKQPFKNCPWFYKVHVPECREAHESTMVECWFCLDAFPKEFFHSNHQKACGNEHSWVKAGKGVASGAAPAAIPGGVSRTPNAPSELGFASFPLAYAGQSNVVHTASIVPGGLFPSTTTVGFSYNNPSFYTISPPNWYQASLQQQSGLEQDGSPAGPCSIPGLYTAAPSFGDNSIHGTPTNTGNPFSASSTPSPAYNNASSHGTPCPPPRLRDTHSALPLFPNNGTPSAPSTNNTIDDDDDAAPYPPHTTPAPSQKKKKPHRRAKLPLEKQWEKTQQYISRSAKTVHGAQALFEKYAAAEVRLPGAEGEDARRQRVLQDDQDGRGVRGSLGEDARTGPAGGEEDVLFAAASGWIVRFPAG